MFKDYILKAIDDIHFEGIGFEGKSGKIKKFQYFKRLTIEEIKNCRVYLIIKPLQFFYEVYNLTLTSYSTEILKLKLKERVTSLGFFNKPIEIYWKILAKRENQYQVCYLALESDTIEKTITRLKNLAQVKIEAVTFLPLALVKGILPKEDILLVHKEEDSLWLIVVSEGIPLFIEASQIDEILGVNFNELLARINFLKNLHLRELKRNIETIVVTRKDLWEELQKLELESKLLEEAYSEYWGALSIHPEFNFIPEEERAFKKVMECNYKISKALAGLSIVLLIFGAGLHKINKTVEEDVNRKENQIRESLNRLTNEFPQEKLKAFLDYIEEKNKLDKALKPDKILEKIIISTGDVLITSLEIKGTGGNYTISLSGERPGPMEDLSEFSRKISENLQRFIDIRENKFEYSTEEGKIIFHIRGVLLL